MFKFATIKIKEKETSVLDLHAKYMDLDLRSQISEYQGCIVSTKAEIVTNLHCFLYTFLSFLFKNISKFTLIKHCPKTK
jgi:hypothetical protein